MDFSKLLGQIDSVTTTKKTYEKEDMSAYWKPTKDKAGNAGAIIRFLPNKDIDDFPFVRMWNHSFKNEGVTPNRWYIENSLSTIGGQDYIGTINQELWNTGIEENRAICRAQKRKLSYTSNIFVIKDSGNPDNNGKLFKYKYGQKIFEKIVGATKPNLELDEVAINAFDVYEGADFLLKMQKSNDQFNYDASKFSAIKPLFGGDEDKINEVLAQCHDLNLEVASEKFKTEAELKSKYLWVMNITSPKPSKDSEEDKEIGELEKMISEPAVTPKKAVDKVVKPKPPLPTQSDSSDDDDEAAFFASLSNSD